MYSNLVILTGAGISAESGLNTFRGEDGLWEGHHVEDVASPEGFARNPELVQHFYNLRRQQLLTVDPNPAHEALSRLEDAWEGSFLLITQNVDDLHERAGSRNVLHMHGELRKARCMETEIICRWDDDIDHTSRCPCCNQFETLRPHIVWFGEMPLELERIYQALQNADMFIAIGTSGVVYPAAGFVAEARQHDAYTMELNLEPSTVESLFDECIYGLAATTVPQLVDTLLALQQEAHDQA
ncbi:MAG: NAD-dependent protein deacylase [Hyphomicrobiales bacterium]|nr:NAD-dependent protein deacylase [Rickettsiales bacterium]MCP5361207.1 NAD-dependent protein deacylase [Hyphomicrobiales bacterium]